MYQAHDQKCIGWGQRYAHHSYPAQSHFVVASWRHCRVNVSNLLNHAPIGLQGELGLKGQGKLVKQVRG